MLKRAVSAWPGSSIPIYNPGNLYWRTGRVAEAAPCFENAIRLGAGDLAKLNLGTALLALGRFDEGWPLYDARPEHANSQAHKLSFPEWTGESLAGKSLVIWPGQRFGGQILAARYVANLGRHPAS